MAARQAVLGIDRGGFQYGVKTIFENVSFLLDDARTALVDAKRDARQMKLL